MTRHEPWGEINPPTSASAFNARRVDATHPYDFFWGRDLSGRRLLILRYDHENSVPDTRPKLNGIDLIEPPCQLGEKAALILALKQSDASEIFHQLCTSIVEAARLCATEASALSAAIRRAWMWHSLLRSGSDGRLTKSAQQGLFGELAMLLKLAAQFGIADAVRFWRGPLDNPQDFSIGPDAMEVKTHQGSRPTVEVTSEFQLDPTGLRNLFLAVVEVAPAATGMAGAKSLDDMVRAARECASSDPAAAADLEGLLAAAGLQADHQYSESVWLITGCRYFHASAGMPRVAAAELPAGVTGVRYSLQLDACAPFAVGEASVMQSLGKV